MNRWIAVSFASLFFALALLPGCGHGSCQAPAPAAAPTAPATTAPPPPAK